MKHTSKDPKKFSWKITVESKKKKKSESAGNSECACIDCDVPPPCGD